ncbi:unnamed protein product [Paramecium sonneborni]|uniref:Uncharacterized protein n=1 Tax=Paramecium sonneborni TaxID=65129 RepID=A0A8S1QDM4_9CILI|nr:unnamed protein product [Paramecium sonneborni]
MNKRTIIEDLNGLNVSRLLMQIKEVTQDELYEDMTQLKTRALGLLKEYQSSLQQKENIRQLSQQIRKDVTNISNDYSQIIEKMNKSIDYIFKSIERSPIYVLVSFLIKFEPSGISMAYTSIIDVNCRISFIKDQIQQNQTDKKYSQLVIIERVDALQEALNLYKIEKIRFIIKKQNIIMTQCQYDTADLYQIVRKKLQNQSIIEDKDIKRRFFDLALKIKSELPINHPSKKVLVSILYENGQNIDVSEWYDWILNL